MSTPRSLGIWYADPLSYEQARALLAESEARERGRKSRGGSTLACRLQHMAAQYWLGRDIGDEYLMLRPIAARSAHGRALLELVYGQLLVSRHRVEGLNHLEQGFRLASRLFAAGDYLQVMNRHRLLRQLPLSGTPAKAAPLEALLTSARVIERMSQSDKRRGAYRHDPKDTYG